MNHGTKNGTNRSVVGIITPVLLYPAQLLFFCYRCQFFVGVVASVSFLIWYFCSTSMRKFQLRIIWDNKAASKRICCICGCSSAMRKYSWDYVRSLGNHKCLNLAFKKTNFILPLHIFPDCAIIVFFIMYIIVNLHVLLVWMATDVLFSSPLKTPARKSIEYKQKQKIITHWFFLRVFYIS